MTTIADSQAPATTKMRSYRWAKILVEVLKYGLLIAVAISFIMPIYWMISSGLKDDPQVRAVPPILIPIPAHWENFAVAWNIHPFTTFAYNTIFRYALPTVLITLVSSTFIAYGFSKIQWPGRDVIFYLVLATMMLPWAVKMIPVFIGLKWLGWLDTYRFWTVTALFGHPYFIFMLRQFFRSIPEALSESARLDGAGDLTILLRIIVPLSYPALAVVALFRFLWAWNDYLGPLLFIRSEENYPLGLGIELLRRAQYTAGGCDRCIPHLMAVSALITLPIIILFFFAQRTFIEGINLTGTKG